MYHQMPFSVEFLFIDRLVNLKFTFLFSNEQRKKKKKKRKQKKTRK